MGHEVTVIASLVSFNAKGEKCLLPKAGEYEDPNGFKVIRLDYKKPTRLNRALRHYANFKDRLIEEQPDIIFSHNVGFADTNILAQYLKENKHVKLFCDNHIDYINYGNNFFTRIILNKWIRASYGKKLLPYISRFYGVTPMRCRFIKDIYHAPKEIIHFLPMGVDDDAIPQNPAQIRSNIRKQLGIAGNDFVIFTGGKIDRRKNTHILIEAINQIGLAHIHLVICGVLTSEMNYLKKVIDNTSNIHAMGWCDAKRVIDCMTASDMACFPGTHSTLWEQAVGLGLPAIFKKWEEMEHVNVNGNGIMVSGSNVLELKDAILKTMKNIESIKALSAKAAETFLYSKIASKAIDM